MAEAEATIPETLTNIQENDATNVEKSKTGAENSEGTPNNATVAQPVEAPAPKRGRPAGSKDKAPRRKVRVEPITQEEEPPPPAAKPKAAPPPVQEQPQRQPPSPERTPPPSPRTLYRQTSAHLVTLRDALRDQRRGKVAEQYTSKLHSWVV